MFRNFQLKRLSVCVAAACTVMGTGAAQAGIGFRAGNWDLDISGNVNGFATWNKCDNKSFNIAGGLACNNGDPTGAGNDTVQSIESGLLPSALVFSAKTRQANLDIGFTIGFYPTLRTNPGVGSGNTALGNASINVRQNFLTFGDKSWGQVKVGRDIGLYASDAILADMTLLGVGSGAAFLGGVTTLGRIGIGYIYTDWIPQITYSSPDWSGFKFAVGAFQGLDLQPVLVGVDPDGTNLTNHSQPGFQGKVSYEWKATVGGKVWASFMQQTVKANNNQFAPGSPGTPSINGFAWDVGGQLNIAGFQGVLYYYDAGGIGTTAIGLGAAAFANGTLQKRDSNGGYAQVTYKLGPVKLGYSYGQSNLKFASNETALGNPLLVKKNSSNVIGAYYALTESLNLVGEVVWTEAEAQGTNPGVGGGNKISDTAFILGAILFF